MVVDETESGYGVVVQAVHAAGQRPEEECPLGFEALGKSTAENRVQGGSLGWSVISEGGEAAKCDGTP